VGNQQLKKKKLTQKVIGSQLEDVIKKGGESLMRVSTMSWFDQVTAGKMGISSVRD